MFRLCRGVDMRVEVSLPDWLSALALLYRAPAYSFPLKSVTGLGGLLVIWDKHSNRVTRDISQLTLPERPDDKRKGVTWLSRSAASPWLDLRQDYDWLFCYPAHNQVSHRAQSWGSFPFLPSLPGLSHKMNGSVSLRDELLTKEELREKFGVLNYVVFFAMLVVSVLIGVFYWYRGNKTTEDFLLASRSMSTGQYIYILTHPRTHC